MSGAEGKGNPEAPIEGERGDVAWSALVVVGLMFLLPLVQPRHTSPITSFYSEWLAFVLGTLALLPLALRRYALPLTVPHTFVVPVMLAGVALAHLLTLRSTYPQPPLIAVVYLAWGAGLMLTAAALRRTFGVHTVAVVLAAFLLTGALLNTLAALLQHYEWRGPFESVIATKLGHQVYGNLGQPNHFATHITLGLVSLGFLHANGRVSARSAIGAALPMLFVLALSGSRSTWIYLASIALLAGARYRAVRSDEARRAMHFALWLLPGLVTAHLIAQLPWLQPATLHTTTLDRMFALAGTTSERLQLWREAWHMFLGAPLLGVGWGEFAWHHFMLNGKEALPIPRLYNHAHNLVLQLLAETGLLGGGIAVGGMLFWARNARGVLAQRAGLWFWGCALVLFVHSMLEYPLWNAHFLGIACVVLGMADERAFRVHRIAFVRAPVVVFVLGAAAGSAFILQSYYRLEAVVHARYASEDEAALERAHRHMLDVSSAFFLAPYVDLAYARDLDFGPLLRQTKLEFAARVMHFAPTGLVACRYAALLALAGREAEAREVLGQAALGYPDVLEKFASEFASASTGDHETQARFVDALKGMADAREMPKVTAGE